MWRHFDEPVAGLTVLQSEPTQRPRNVRRARAARRRRLQVADGLCSVARSAGPRAKRHRHELLLIPRAIAVRTALLEVAALVRCSTNLDPECIADLYTLLTNGCDSPLYNPDVPVEHLQATLLRARMTLASRPALPDRTPTS